MRRALLCLLLWLPACRDTTTPADRIPADQRIIALIPETVKGTLDPRLNTRAWPAKIIHLVYEGVVSVHNPQGEPRPALAARIERPAPEIYEIVLRPDASFHDGSPVTAADVEATYASIRDPQLKSPFRGLYARIARMEVLGPRRLRLTLDAPHAPFLSDLSVGILPKAALGPDGHLQGDAPGAGPYRIVSRAGEREVLLARHDTYWRGRPTTPYLVFRTVSDQNTRVLALLGGAADVTQNAVTPRMADALRGREGLTVQTASGAGYSYVAYNLRRAPFDDVRVRRALFHAVDRDALITHKFRGTATKASGLLPERHWAFEAAARKHPHDLQEARRLLDAAGLTRPADGGPRFSMTFKVSADKFRRNIATLIAGDLAQVGVEVKVQPLETGTMLADVKAGNFDVYMLQWQGGGEPHLYNWLFHGDRIPTPAEPNRGGNRGAYRSARVDALIDGGRAETDLVKRRAIYQELQRVLAEDLPYLSLWHEGVVVVRRSGLKGYDPLPSASMFPLWRAGW